MEAESMAAPPRHFLRVQRRSIRRVAHRAQWRSDWAPFGLVLLLLGVLILLTMVLPSKEVVQTVKQASHDEGGRPHQLPVVGMLTEP